LCRYGASIPDQEYKEVEGSRPCLTFIRAGAVDEFKREGHGIGRGGKGPVEWFTEKVESCGGLLIPSFTGGNEGVGQGGGTTNSHPPRLLWPLLFPPPPPPPKQIIDY
jgi:hypothetical protein